MTDAFSQGYLARQRAESTSSCEHAGGSTHHREWLRGWTEAQVEERANDAEAEPEYETGSRTGTASA